MALSGLKPPGPLCFEGKLAMNRQNWLSAFDIYSGAAGVTATMEKTQCCILHVAGPEAQKLYRTFKIYPAQDKIKPLIKAFRKHCEGKFNITVVQYEFNSFNQSTQNMDTYL